MSVQNLMDACILIIDDQEANLRAFELVLQLAGYTNLRSLSDSRQVLPLLQEIKPDLIILDLHMPHLDGLAVLDQLARVIHDDDYLPVIVLTGDSTLEAKEQALSRGAKDFLSKPLNRVEMQLRVKNLLQTRWLHVELQRHNVNLAEKVRERTRDLELAKLEILQRLALASEFRDDCTGQHTQRVGDLAALLGRTIGLPDEQVELIRQAAPLHDVGKIGVPDKILLKPGRLTDEEYRQIKRHTDIGQRILSGSRFPILQMAERIALYHHEHWNGSGYYGLAGEEIPLEARIVSVADVFDVITHARPYKAADDARAAVERIRQQRGLQFDPAIVDAFLELEVSGSLANLGAALDHDSPALASPVAERESHEILHTPA